MEASNSYKIQVLPKSNSIAWVSVTQSQRVPSGNTTSSCPLWYLGSGHANYGKYGVDLLRFLERKKRRRSLYFHIWAQAY
jgi:hypothetical protein